MIGHQISILHQLLFGFFLQDHHELVGQLFEEVILGDLGESGEFAYPYLP